MLIWRKGFSFYKTHFKKERKVSANQENKKKVVAELKEQLSSAKSIILVDYRGITVSEDTALRKSFRNDNVSYKVVKNNLLKRALQDLNITLEDAMYEGTTAIAFSSDEVAPARIFCKTAKDLNKMAVKCGVVNGKIMSASEVEALSKVPSKEVLIAMLLGTLQAPISSFARALNLIAEGKNN